MPVLHLLGTGAAVSDAHRNATMLALEWDGGTFLIDCGGDVVQRALLAGIDLAGIEGMFITHEHPDHVSGFPLFLERVWLDGRSRPLNVYGNEPAVDQARRVLAAFDTNGWKLPNLVWRSFAQTPKTLVLETNEWRVVASPGKHGVPSTGLRFEHRPSQTVVVYSSDTEPCDSILDLAQGCDVLVHEATGRGKGHSSIGEAVQVAEEAGANHLVLVHLSRGVSPEDLSPFKGSPVQIVLGEELDRFEF